jgi:pimeloyl-ACP methyl ester carboxylesterase
VSGQNALAEFVRIHCQSVKVLAIALTVSTCVGCSHIRSGAAAETGQRPPPPADAIDHVVPHISTAAANAGGQVSLFMRERRRAASGPVVLLIHGRAAAALPSFDLAYRDYSWLAYLADAGFDAFALDHQGYGNSSTPSVMDDPCNTSAENQAKYLVPKPLAAPCPPRYQQPFGSFATDWDEMDTAVEFIRSLRGNRALKVNLVGWSRGGMRVIGYAGSAAAGERRVFDGLPRSARLDGRPTFPAASRRRRS